MMLAYPLQRRARHRVGQLQLEFIDRARRMLRAAEDCRLMTGGRSLMLVARNEEALEAPMLVLREHFGHALELGPLQVRLAGSPPHEPVMRVRVNAPVARVERVRQVLRQRGVTPVRESLGLTRCLLLGEARLASLLGMGSELRAVSLGSALLWTEVDHYAPCSPGSDAQAPQPALHL